MSQAIEYGKLRIKFHQIPSVYASNGIVLYGNIIIPFKDRFDRNTKLYALMTTKMSEK